jgi:phage terminase large subunit
MAILEIATPRWAAPALSPARYKAIYGGRGSGKSHFVGEYIVEEHILNPNDSTVCVREIQKSLDQSVKRLLEGKIQKLNAGDYFEVLDAKIRSKRGTGVITFQGLQNHTADSIKSLEGYKRAWVEEAQTLSQYSLDLLRPTIRVPGSELIFTWNPRFKTDAVDVFFRKKPPESSIILNVNWNKNPWFPDELRREMQEDFERDPDKAEHIWNGAYGATQGAILARWVNQAIRTGRCTPDVEFDREGAPIEISCDLGFRDTAAFWYWQRTLGGFRVLAYDADTGLDADDWIPRIKDKIIELGAARKLGKIWLPHDARAKTFQSKHTTIDRFITAFGADKCAIVAQSKKIDQISAARAVMPRCEFNSVQCENGIDGLTAWEYAYNEDLGVFSREPLHNWASHPADAFCYGAQVMEQLPAEEPKTLPKFPVTGHNGRIVTIPIDDLWADTNKRNERY